MAMPLIKTGLPIFKCFQIIWRTPTNIIVNIKDLAVKPKGDGIINGSINIILAIDTTFTGLHALNTASKV